MVMVRPVALLLPLLSLISCSGIEHAAPQRRSRQPVPAPRRASLLAAATPRQTSIDQAREAARAVLTNCRLVAFSSEVGEAFRPVWQVSLVRASLQPTAH